MYEIDGDFGRVRHIRMPMGGQRMEVPFQFSSGGWHCCNDKYQPQREGLQEEHLLLFSLSEGGRVQLEGKSEIRLPAGSVAWLPPKRAHKYGTVMGGVWEFYWIFAESTESLQLDKVFNDDFVLILSNMDTISKEFEKMIHKRYDEPAEFQVEGSKLLGNIYHMLLQEKILQKKQCGKWDELVHRIIGEMEEHCEWEWELPEIAKQHYISVPQLIRRFKAQTGLTPHAYLLTVRLRTAELYLKYTNMSVDEISKRTGFPNTSNFILQFRKEKGITPGKYRQSAAWD